MIRAVTVALRTRNMTEAALILGISQSAVTQYVNKFEMITGVKILSRVGNNLFVERTDIAEIMEMITELSLKMDRLVNAKAQKATLALPFSIATLVGMHPELASWIAEQFHCETMTFKELAKQSGQNSFDFIVRPLRARETDVDYQFDCLFRFLKPQEMHMNGSKPDVLPVLMPGGECPTHAAGITFLQDQNIDYAEVGRSEDIAYRAMNLNLGLSATLLPHGVAEYSTQYHNFVNRDRIGEPFNVRFGLVAQKKTSEKSNALGFLEQLCGKLQDYGVVNGT